MRKLLRKGNPEVNQFLVLTAEACLTSEVRNTQYFMYVKVQCLQSRCKFPSCAA